MLVSPLEVTLAWKNQYKWPIKEEKEKPTHPSNRKTRGLEKGKKRRMRGVFEGTNDWRWTGETIWMRGHKDKKGR